MPPSNTRSGPQNHVSSVAPNLAFVVMIFGALIAFEVFNYSTTDHALGDLLGSLSFAGIQWSTILALAFCGIDFAGIARLFTPEQGEDEPKEVWYLFGAWLLAATMNAILTWWGVSMAVSNHNIQSSSTVITPQTLNTVVPVFVAIMVWVIRILIIGTLALSMDRLLHPGVEQRIPLQSAFSAAAHHQPAQAPAPMPMTVPAGLNSSVIPPRPSVSRSHSPANPRYNRPVSVPQDTAQYIPEAPVRGSRPEPTYHTLSMSARPSSHKSGTNGGQNTGSNRFQRS